MLRAIITAWKKYAVYRATYRELDSLTDKELADIGLSRSDFEFVAREAAYGPEMRQNFDFITNLFKVKTEKEKRDEYLAESVSIMDLENRIKSIDRGLAPWQVKGKNYAQGLI